ncbi:MAG: hypothetical protein WBG08_12435, partial [Litorimonas sp.]
MTDRFDVPSASSARNPSGQAGGWLGMALLLVLVAVASVWAALAWSSLQPALQVLVGGIIALSVLLACGLLIVMRAGGQSDRRAARRDSLY